MLKDGATMPRFDWDAKWAGKIHLGNEMPTLGEASPGEARCEGGSPMATEDRSSQREKLEAERQRILNQLQNLQEVFRVEVDTDPEEGDPDLYEREKNLALVAALQRELASIETALRAIDQGTYGICERCGRPISPERLEVRPDATLCVQCQAEVERLARRRMVLPNMLGRQGMFSYPTEDQES